MLWWHIIKYVLIIHRFLLVLLMIYTVCFEQGYVIFWAVLVPFFGATLVSVLFNLPFATLICHKNTMKEEEHEEEHV